MLNSIVIKLLREGGKVSLPSIGIIVKVDVEDDTAYFFTPTALKTDSRMIDMVVAEMDVDRDEAVHIITSYVEFIKSIISKNGKYPLKGIGDIKRHDQGTFYFEPAVQGQEQSVKTEIEQEQKQEVIEPVVEEVVEEESVKGFKEFQLVFMDDEEESVVETEVEQEQKQEVIEEVEVQEESEKEERKEESVVETEVEQEQKQEVIEEVKVQEESEKEEPKEEIKEEEQTRLNERFQARRLGEMIEGSANKRFYDQIHSQVVTKNIEDVVKERIVDKIVEAVKEETLVKQEKEEVETTQSQSEHTLSQDTLREMLGHTKRKGLYEIYDKKAFVDKSRVSEEEVTPVVVPLPTPVSVPSPDPVHVPSTYSVEIQMPKEVSMPQVPISEVSDYIEPKQQQRAPKKKVDFVLVISFAVIVLGLAVIAYFYYMQQELGL